MKIAPALLTITGILGAFAAASVAQAQTPSSAPAKSVSRTTKAMNYRRGGPVPKIDFQGTELMQQATGEAKVQNKGNRVEIEVKFLCCTAAGFVAEGRRPPHVHRL